MCMNTSLTERTSFIGRQVNFRAGMASARLSTFCSTSSIDLMNSPRMPGTSSARVTELQVMAPTAVASSTRSHFI